MELRLYCINPSNWCWIQENWLSSKLTFQENWLFVTEIFVVLQQKHSSYLIFISVNWLFKYIIRLKFMKNISYDWMKLVTAISNINDQIVAPDAPNFSSVGPVNINIYKIWNCSSLFLPKSGPEGARPFLGIMQISKLNSFFCYIAMVSNTVRSLI